MSLMLEEWNLEDAIKYNREDAKAEGLAQGLKKGLAQGRNEGLAQGLKNGMVYAYYEMNMQTNEIAKKVQLTESEVIEIIKNMKNNM